MNTYHALQSIGNSTLTRYRPISLWLFGMILLISGDLKAQLDSVHWIPPMHSRETSQIQDHYVYLSTLETVAFTVTITDGAGNELATPSISKSAPFIYTIASDDPSEVMLARSDLNTVLTGKGLILKADKPFYANFRGRNSIQAGSLTAKGRAAAGLVFRAGSMPQIEDNTVRNFFAGVMATEDNTQVTISDYDTNVEFDDEGGNITADVITVTLDEGESYVVAGNTDVAANRQGFVGALIESTKPIVVNNGNWTGTIGSTLGSQDIGIDQAVPVTQIGDEYILIEGDGTSEMERPLVIAHFDGTEVFINGAPTAETTINAGEFFLVPNSFYTGTDHGNIYIRTSRPAYMYQPLGGDADEATPGLNFIPPISCFLPSEVQLSSIDQIGTITYNGAIIAFTLASATLSINGTPTTATAETVDGLGGEWVSYKIKGFTGDVNVSSTGALAVGLFGFDDKAGFAGYFSGFGVGPAVEVTTGVCSPGAVIQASNEFESYQWLSDGTEIIGATDRILTVDAPGFYQVEATKGACKDISTSFFIPGCPTAGNAAKQSSEEREVTDNIYEVDYKITVANTGAAKMYNIQVIDSLEAPPCAVITLTQGPTLDGGGNILSGGGPNTGFVPGNGQPGSDLRLLLGTDTLAAGASDTIRYTLRFDMTNNCQGTFTNQAYLSTSDASPNDGTDPGGGLGASEGSGDNTVCLPANTSFSYGSSSFATIDGVQVVTITGFTGGTFSATPAGLTIDAGTGEITPSSSAKGDYQITYAYGTGACAGTATFSVDIITDSDMDGIPDEVEIGPDTGNPLDTDGDGTPDYLDTDSDEDGIPDEIEAGDTPEVPRDSDEDGTQDYRDTDDDDDGDLTKDEDADTDGNPLNDDCDSDTVPDYLDTDPCDILMIEGFSPNGDGTNDLFVIKGLEAYPNNRLRIFNRWGSTLIDAAPYKNDWDGTNTKGITIGDEELPEGTYFYVLELGDGSDPIKGYIYLKR